MFAYCLCLLNCDQFVFFYSLTFLILLIINIHLEFAFDTSLFVSCFDSEFVIFTRTDKLNVVKTGCSFVQKQ